MIKTLLDKVNQQIKKVELMRQENERQLKVIQDTIIELENLKKRYFNE